MSVRLGIPLFLLALMACASAPDTGVRPAIRSAGTVAASQTLAPPDPDMSPPDQWGERAGDPQLTALIEEGLANAPQVALAAARIRRATMWRAKMSGRTCVAIRNASPNPRMIASASRSPLRCSKALVATVVPIRSSAIGPSPHLTISRRTASLAASA